MHNAVPTIASCGVSPIVRIADNQSWMVKRALDAGARKSLSPSPLPASFINSLFVFRRCSRTLDLHPLGCADTRQSSQISSHWRQRIRLPVSHGALPSRHHKRAVFTASQWCHFGMRAGWDERGIGRCREHRCCWWCRRFICWTFWSREQHWSPDIRWNDAWRMWVVSLHASKIAYPWPNHWWKLSYIVQAAIARILTAAKKNGKHAGIFCTSGEQAKKFADDGFTMVSAATDVMILQKAVGEAVDTGYGRESNTKITGPYGKWGNSVLNGFVQNRLWRKSCILQKSWLLQGVLDLQKSNNAKEVDTQTWLTICPNGAMGFEQAVQRSWSGIFHSQSWDKHVTSFSKPMLHGYMW